MRAWKSCLPGLKKSLSAAIYARSRSVFAGGVCAFCISAHALFMVLSSGRFQIWWNSLIASPQCAIEHVGSALTIASNCRFASEYQKSCSSATPRLNGACVDGKQETGNETTPSFSERAIGGAWDGPSTSGPRQGTQSGSSRDNASIFIALDYKSGSYLLTKFFAASGGGVSRLRAEISLVACRTNPVVCRYAQTWKPHFCCARRDCLGPPGSNPLPCPSRRKPSCLSRVAAPHDPRRSRPAQGCR